MLTIEMTTEMIVKILKKYINKEKSINADI